MKKITLKNPLPLGDNVIMSATIYSLHKQFPGKYLTAVDTKYPEVFENNPDVVKSDNDFEVIEANYPTVHQSNSISVQYINGYLDDLAQKLGIPLKLQTNRPHLYLTPDEKYKFKDEGDYWIIISSGKSDFTTKHLPKAHLQEVVNHFIGNVKFIQPTRSTDINYPLNNVKRLLNLNIRDIFSLVERCKGIIGPVTSWMHIAAALNKPYIAVAGNREPLSWISMYNKQFVINNMGTMDCCKDKACWKSKVIKSREDDDTPENKFCENPIYYEQQWVPRCLLKIKPKLIIDVMEMYL